MDMSSVEGDRCMIALLCCMRWKGLITEEKPTENRAGLCVVRGAGDHPQRMSALSGDTGEGVAQKQNILTSKGHCVNSLLLIRA